MSIRICLFVWSALCFLPMQLRAQEDGPADFQIQGLRSQGRGCPEGSVFASISEDKQAFTLTFSDFLAEIGPTTGRLTEARGCRVVLDTVQQQGWEYAVLAVSFRGFAALDAGVEGTQRLRFGGPNNETESEMKLQGPFEGDYINTREVLTSQLRWSGCRVPRVRDFAINGNVRLQSEDDNASGLFTVDSIDGEIKQDYELVWRSCQGRPRPLAVCRLNIKTANLGNERQLLSKAFGRNANQALNKARAKMERKCERWGRQGRSCQASEASCSVVEL